LNLIQEGALL